MIEVSVSLDFKRTARSRRSRGGHPRQYPDRRRHMSTPTSLSFEERKKKLEADQAAYEEEERVRLEL